MKQKPFLLSKCLVSIAHLCTYLWEFVKSKKVTYTTQTCRKLWQKNDFGNEVVEVVDAVADEGEIDVGHVESGRGQGQIVLGQMGYCRNDVTVDVAWGKTTS